MANLLAQSLGLPDTSLNRFVEKFEDLSGYPSEDSRLTSNLIAANSAKIAQLGLDPGDTTSKELYQALLISYEQTAQAFARAIGQQADDNLAGVYTRIDKVLAQQAGQPVWAVKRAELKKLLAKSPPRRLMKHLHYRTADSLLKREDARLLFLVGQWVESARWRKQISKAIASLPPSGFENQPAQALVLPVGLWRGLGTKRPLIISQPEVGLVAVWPNGLAKNMTTLGVITLALQALDELTGWSASLDFHFLSPDFGKLAVNAWSQSQPIAFEVANRPVAWRSLCGRYGNVPGKAQAEDANLLESDTRLSNPWQTSRRLSRLHILLNWWADNDHLIYIDGSGQAVSLSLADVAVNHALKAPFSRRTLSFARQRLFDELLARYFDYPGVINMVLSRLTGESEHPKLGTRRRPTQLIHQLGNS